MNKWCQLNQLVSTIKVCSSTNKTQSKTFSKTWILSLQSHQQFPMAPNHHFYPKTLSAMAMPIINLSLNLKILNSKVFLGPNTTQILNLSWLRCRNYQAKFHYPFTAKIHTPQRQVNLKNIKIFQTSQARAWKTCFKTKLNAVKTPHTKSPQASSNQRPENQPNALFCH